MKGRTMYLEWAKPFIDKVFALSFLIISLPIILILIILLVIINRGEVFFIQTRIGKSERSFNLIKFKTMRDIPGGKEVTSFGSILRLLSLDELPQLVNILKGDMSVVGPRPLLEEYIPYYNEEERVRHTVKPGITGLAQINGRNLASWSQRMDDDIRYVNAASFGLDLKILILTVIQLFRFKQADFEALEQESFIAYAKRRG